MAIKQKDLLERKMSRSMTKPTKQPLVPAKTQMSLVRSDQPEHPPSLFSLHCPPEEGFDPWLPIKHTLKTDQTGRIPG